MRLEKSRGGMQHLDGRPSDHKKAVMTEKLKAARIPVPPRPLAAVDYPRDGERVACGRYALRISAPDQGSVDISIDEGAWRSCRNAAGYWWYDWSGYGPGPHSVAARVSLHKRRRSISERRDFVVVPA